MDFFKLLIRLKNIYRVVTLLCFIFSSKINFAQLCKGSLGDPVVNITFGSGSGSGNPIDATNYYFQRYPCPNDGSYTIATSSPECFGNTWHTVSEDHTPGDAGGYMMIVNASFVPGVFYIDTVSGLCGGTTYEFAAWVLNVLKPGACPDESRPNLTFNIETVDGAVLKTYKTGDIYTSGSPQWQQYGTFFSTPDNISTVVIRLTNNAPGGCGNDLLLDDLTFRPCGPKITMTLDGTTTLTKDICIGNNSSVNLAFTTEGEFTNPYYQWQTSVDGLTWNDIAGANSDTYTRTPTNTAGKYMFRVAAAQAGNFSIPSCKIFSDVVTITENDIPVVEATNNSPQCIGKSVILSASAGVSFEWSGPAGYKSSLQQATISAVSEASKGIYNVKVTSAQGCVNSASTVVTLQTSPVVNAGEDVNICKGKTTVLKGSASNYNELNWLPSTTLSNLQSNNPVASPQDSTFYILRASNGLCEIFDTVAVNVYNLPSANAGADKVTIKDNPVMLDGSAEGTAVTYTWSPNINISSPNVLQPMVSPSASALYVLKVESNNGCGVAADSVFVKVYQGLFIPNAFSPNNDGLNDIWRIETLDAFPKAELKVFNRFGEMVYSNKNKNNYWDGKFKNKDAPVGTYPYILDLKNGATVLKGFVVLIR